MLNVISTCRDIPCVDINVDKRCVDHSTIIYIAKTAIQAEICVAKCLKCGVFCCVIQSNLHPECSTTFISFYFLLNVCIRI